MAQHGDSAPLIAASGGWKTLTMVQRYVNMQSVGKRHPMPAGARIATALDGKSTELIGQPGTATAVSNGKHTFPEPAIESSKALKPRRGRPKVPWEPVADELDRRLKAGKALPTVTAESKYLHEWSKNNQNRFKQYAISASGKKDMMVNSPERISVRIKKRIGSSQLYRDKREEHLSRLQSMATKN
jgi:hypothetical protein